MSNDAARSQIIDELQQSPHRHVKVAIADLDGVLRGKYMHKDKLLSALDDGFGFCDVIFGWDLHDQCFDHVDFTGWHTGYPDTHVALDPTTARKIPWEDDVMFVLGHGVDAHGQPLDVCPRQLLRRVVARAHDAGFEPFFGVEYEWFNFEETPQSMADKGHLNPRPLTPGMFGYSILRPSLRSDYFRALLENLEAFAIPIEGLHTETGPGVYEAAIRYGRALDAADCGVLFKTAVKEIAYRHGVMATFMARWNMALPGCSGHLHQSLWSRDDDPQNLFFDPSHDRSSSDLLRHYLAGQLLCMPEILPMYAPTVNSYKRLREGFWAPTRATWAHDNRTVALRVISGGKATRIETRVSGSDANAHLAIAAALASGLYGIAHKLEPQTPPVVGNGYTAEAPRLPTNLGDAAQRMANSPIAHELFGDTFVKHFTTTRLWEWQKFNESVTDWEMRRYFELI